jgi:uncharacterized damage-inducible protein DinB
MNTNAFSHLYDYHFAENRKIWDKYISSLTQEQFTKEMNYAQGSVREQVLHLIDVDEAWFCDLSGADFLPPLAEEEMNDLGVIRARWDKVERMMRDYLEGLADENLTEKPLQGEDANLILWQVLLHVANHGTDHRAQLLRYLNDLGAETESQDYIFYVYRNP